MRGCAAVSRDNPAWTMKNLDPISAGTDARHPIPGDQRLALVGHRLAGDVLAWRGRQAITVREFLADVDTLAALLPDAHYMLNGCVDRYRFTVAMGAALLRGQVSVLPHNHVPATLSHLVEQFQGLYCLTDTDDVFPELIRVRFPASLVEKGTLGAEAAASDRAVERPTDTLPVEAIAGFARFCIPSSQMAACLFTSGSTGTPVAHRRTWGQVVQSARSEARRLTTALSGACAASTVGAAAPSSAEAGPLAILGTVPAQHSYGFESTVFLALLAGWSFAAERPFFPADVLESLRCLPRPRLLVTTPVHLRALLGTDAAGVAADLVLSATAPLPEELAAGIEGRLEAPVYEIYGSTETGQVATRRTLDGDEWQPLDGVTIGESDGQAFASGAHVGGQISLSDRIELRERGRFVLLGRSADMVNIAGKRSSIAFLEKQLLSIAGVVDGAFLIDDDRGKVNARVQAFVVAPGLSAEQITGALRPLIEAVFLPRPLYKVDALPRDATGKLPRQRIEALARALSAGRAP